VLTLALLAGLLAVAWLGPGLLLVRRLRWSPVETLCASVGASLLAVHLAGWALFAAGLPSGSAWWVSGACAGATLLTLPDLARLARRQEVRRLLLGGAVLLGWTLLLLACVRLYCGGGWYGDWLEHYERALFFVDRGDPHASFLDGRYALPARPPLMNVVAAHFLAQTDRSYALYQVVASFLGVLTYGPAALLVRVVGGRRRSAFPLLAALLALNPFFVQNATFPWTKLLSAFYVLLGIALYLRGWRRADTPRLVGSAVALAAAILVHYSAAPFALAIALHHLGTAVRAPRRQALVALPGMAVAAGAVLATWIAWSVAALGVQSTFASNTAVTDAPAGLAENLRKTGGNFVDTIVPHPLRIVPRTRTDATGLGYLNDYFFLLYQHNLFAAIGLLGGAAAVRALYAGRAVSARRRRSPPAAGRPTRAAERRFWTWLIAFSTVLGVASVGASDENGVTHVVLQPVVLLGLVAIAVSWPLLSSAWRRAVVFGAAIDLAAGILVHFVAQASDPAAWTVAGAPRRALRPVVTHMTGEAGFANGVMKLRHGLSFVGDYVDSGLPLVLVALVAGGCALLLCLLRAADEPSSTARWR
jgi:hypothetical protein